ncbi:hypothetical protein [Kibdelosporangium aridum]|uniref:Uncharacterized protein n=1 Tax=Kibdelosporangium aridum TaxID=2030 RepID=A0A1Y5Y4U0_KIBAR|nr:hypothetical protein [Kibdelosporangium aridum]SMD25838.1 hypothetical protein SAMN05661093_09416 [Kibdelosporangium aridum]
MGRGKAELVHLRVSQPNPRDPSARRALPERRVSPTEPLAPAPDDPVFASAVTLRCDECEEDYRVGLLKRSVLARRQLRNYQLWICAAITAGLESLLVIAFPHDLMINDEDAVVAYAAFSVFVLFAALPLYIAWGGIRALRGKMLKVDESEPPAEDHGWVWTRPSGRMVAYLPDLTGFTEGDRRRVYRIRQSDPAPDSTVDGT